MEKRTQLNFRIPNELAIRIENFCKINRIQKTEFIAKALTHYLDSEAITPDNPSDTIASLRLDNLTQRLQNLELENKAMNQRLGDIEEFSKLNIDSLFSKLDKLEDKEDKDKDYDYEASKIEIRRLHDLGKSTAEIAKSLNSNGFPSAKGIVGSWQGIQVQRILEKEKTEPTTPEPEPQNSLFNS